MRVQHILAIALVGIALFAFAGCNGPSPGLDPQITWTIDPEENSAFIPSGQELAFTVSAEAIGEEDRIISYAWTQEPEVPGSFFVSPDQAETIWVAPTLLSTDSPLPVKVILRVKTLMGGESVKTLNLVVTPPPPPV